MSDEKKYKVTWSIEETHPDLVEKLRTSLSEVVDPEIGLNIIELGLVRDVRMTSDSAEMTMILTTPFCPYGPAMLETARKKAEECLERPVIIEMGMEMWHPSMIEEGAGAEWGLFY